MDSKKSKILDKCKLCKQYLADVVFYEEVWNNANASNVDRTEEVVIGSNQFYLYAGYGEVDSKKVPSVKLTSFVMYDKYGHLCSFDDGLVEKGIDIFFSGYVKTVDNEDSTIKGGILIQNGGPIKEWWIYGFDGGETSLIGLSTEHALYYLMEPCSLYKHIFENLKLKNKLSKIVIEFLLDFGYQNPTFEDLLQHIKIFDIPDVEELLFREAQFLCNQILSYDEEPTDEVPMISFSCIQTLINLTGITVAKENTRIEAKDKENISSPKAVSTILVREVFEKCFQNQLNNSSFVKEVDECCEENNNDICGKITNFCESPEPQEDESHSESGHQPIKHRECSKLIVHSVEWLKKSSMNYNGNQRYLSAVVDNFVVRQGDCVMLKAEDPNEHLRIAKICYMYSSPVDGAIFHAHFFCRGIDTILGDIANPRELFIVDDCDDYPLGCIIQKTEVKFIKPPQNWSNLGNSVNLPSELEDNNGTYYFSKIYDYEFSKFRDYTEDVDDENPCLSCKWQQNIKINTTPMYKDNYVMWRSDTFKVGTAVFLEPGNNKYVHETISEEQKYVIDDKLHTEMYRKKLDTSKGSNLDTPTPFTVGLIEDIRRQRNDIKIKVRMFYRPEDTRQAHFLAYVSDINYLFWSDHVIWTTFGHVSGKCYVTYAENEYLGQIWSQEGPFRFYYTKAYDYKNHNVYDVPINAQKVCYEFLNERVRITRSSSQNMKTNNLYNFAEIPSVWQTIKEPLKCMDIYAGCGGLSEGLHQSGVAKTLWAVEKETAPAQAYKVNNPDCKVFTDDCNNVLEALLGGKGESFGYPNKGDVELLIGGPPCQGFSGMNRFSNRQDSYFNNSQIITYLSYCDYYRPKYFIFENVRNFVSFRKNLVFKLTLKCLLAIGYQISFGILQAGNFGVPQTRRRFILMGAAPGYTLPSLPDPLHVFSRSGTCLSILVDGLRYDTGSLWCESLPYRTICVRDAIADLPDIKNGATATEIPYDEEPKSHFQKGMRENNRSDSVKDHICKEMSLIVEARISHIPTYPGADWRDLPNIAVQLRDGSVAKVLKYPYRKKDQSKFDRPRGVCKCAQGNACDPSDRQFNTLIPWFLAHTADRHNNWVAVYGRLEWDGFFGTTITNPEPTGTQGRVLHPDQNRVVSVRECARSQGFPDNYKFSGNILDKHRQIGNAVPPPLALALGREIIKACNILIKKN